MKNSVIVLFAGICLLAGTALPQSLPVPQSQHVWIVAEENHTYEEVIGSSEMPYFNSLATKYGLATQYYSTQHNSLAALMWFVAGEEVTTDDNASGCFNVDNVVRHVLAQHSTWKAYEEDLPYAGFPGLSWANYVRRHNPLIDFTDSCNAAQALNSVPFTELAADIAKNTTPNLSYITPNLQRDGHDGTLAQADQWLSENLPAILAGPEFQPGGDGLLFVFWDEGDLGMNGNPDNRCSELINSGCGGRTATLLIGPQVKPGYRSNTLYSHVNSLATICAAMGFSSCPGAAALALPMSDFFNQVTISTPLPNEQVSSPVRIQASTINASPVYAMQIYVDNRLQYSSGGNQVNTSLATAPGTHNVVVQSWDTAGGIHKRPLTVTVQPEAVVVNSPSPNSVVSSPVTIAASAGGKSAVYAMQVYVDNTLEYQHSGTSISASIPMSPGRHYVVVQAWDDSGGITKNGFSLTVAAPSITIASPASTYSGYSPVSLLAVTQNPNPVFAVQAYVDNVLAYQYTGTGIQADALNMTAGKHTLVVQSWDATGGIQKKSVNVNVIPIPVTVSSPQTNTGVASPVQVSASVPGNAPVVAMQLYADNQLVYSTSTLTLNTTLSLSAGAHHLVAKAWDAGGGTWTTGVNITVK